MNIGVILAGGIDPNFRMDIPKQFVNVNNIPVIVYTMQKFQNHPDIDVIMVACLHGWENMVSAYAKQFDITKLKWVISGGVSGQESSKLAVDELMKTCDKDDVVLIHDGIRPLVTNEIISDSIFTCRKKGMAVAAVTSMDNVMLTDDGINGVRTISRYSFRRIQSPQAYKLGQLHEYHEMAISKGIQHEVDTNNMVSKLGISVPLSKGSDFNIKINTVEDVEMFKSLYNMTNSDKEY